MAKEYNDVFVFAGSYGSVEDAKMDYDAIEGLHREDWIGKYQAAMFTKRADGKAEVIDTTSTTRATGAKWGAGVGAVLGLLFPPGMILSAATGAGVGALTGNLAKGWFKSDIKEIAEALDVGQTGVVVIAEATPEVGAEKLLRRAVKAEKKMIDADANAAKESLDQMVEV